MHRVAAACLIDLFASLSSEVHSFIFSLNISGVSCRYLKFLNDGGVLHLHFEGIWGDYRFLQKKEEINTDQ